MPGAAHFVTYRLAGTLPQPILDQLREQRDALLKRKPDGRSAVEHQAVVHKQLFAAFDATLDAHRDGLHLTDQRVAAVVRGNLCHHHGHKYFLDAYCIMGNHVHVLFTPMDPSVPAIHPQDGELTAVGEQPDDASPLATIMHSLKSYTAHEANKILGRSGAFWQGESYDHWVRDEAEYARIIDYIAANPVRAGLVGQPQEWYWCSCHDRYLRDGEITAALS